MVCLVYLVCLVEPERPDRPYEPDRLHMKRTAILSILKLLWHQCHSVRFHWCYRCKPNLPAAC